MNTEHKYYVAVPYGEDGKEALYEFKGEKDCEAFMRQARHISPNLYRVSPEEVARNLPKQTRH